MWKFEKFYHRHRRWILFAFSFLSVSLVGGVVYGWPALRQDLLDDGSTLTEKELGAIFTAGAWSTQGGRFFTGMARDRYGTRRVTCFALTCAVAGSLGVALSDLNNGLALGASMLIIGLGSGVQLCLQPLASLFPIHAGSILASFSGAFQVSGLVFLALTSIPISRTSSYLGYAVCIVALILVAAVMLPKDRSFVLENDRSVAAAESDKQTHAAAAADENDDLDKENTLVEEQSEREAIEDASREAEMSIETSASEPADKNTNDRHPTAMQQMRSWEYVCLLVWFSILLVPLQFYVGSVGFQLEERGDDNGVYTDRFSICYASAAVLAPFAGYLADKCGLGVAQAISTIFTAVSMFLLASTSISLDAHTAGLVSYSIGRMFVLGTYFTNVAKRFGYTNYGTLVGLGLLISAIVSLLQYPLIAAASDGHHVAVDIACGIAAVLTLPYCLWLAWRERVLPNPQV